MSISPDSEHDRSLDEDRLLDPETISYYRYMEHLEQQHAKAQAEVEPEAEP